MKKFLRLILLVLMLISLPAQSVAALAATNLQGKAVQKSNSGNPMLGFDENGSLLYGGDPSVLVDGDTVYAYVGHDASETDYYYMPDWRCYSSKDMVNWKYESTILRNSEISWAADTYCDAWAAQVMKYNDKYYFYYCTEGTEAVGGGKCIGVAVSDSATGPFTDIGHPLVCNLFNTEGSIGGWEDIDPTVWVENVDGEEHRIIGWGNSRLFNAELNEDMISIKDQNNDGYINIRGGDIKLATIEGMDDHSGCLKNNDQGITCGDVLWGEHHYTEAPYYYRQQDENGNYFGKYYMFFACDWREQMAYATADTYSDFRNNRWQFGGVIQEPSTTSNTNHMAVFNFKGQPYFVYHTGSLPHGSGYRRVACVEPFEINPDGTIDYIKKTAVGLSGTAYTLQSLDGKFVSHKSFTNIIYEDIYPVKSVALELGTSSTVRSSWSLNKGKSDSSEQYVSIESNNKPGLFISAESIDGVITPVLSQDVDGSTAEARSMTFKDYKGSNDGIMLESVLYPGYFLANKNGRLTLTHSLNYSEATFLIEENYPVSDADIAKSKTLYTLGEVLNDDDIQIMLFRSHGQNVKAESYTTNASSIDMSTTGTKSLEVSYTYSGIRYKSELPITVVDDAYYPSAASLGSRKSAPAAAAYSDNLIASFDFENNLENTLNSTEKATMGVSAKYDDKHDIGTYKYATKYAAGHNGQALKLNDCGVRLNKKSIGEEYTVSFWIMPQQSLVDNQSILFLGYYSPENWLALSGVDYRFTKLWAKGNQYPSWTNFYDSELKMNEWNNVTVTELDGIATLYVNGMMVGSVNSNKPLAGKNSDIYIGVNHWDKGFVGLLDDVTVYNKALPQSAIQSLSLDSYQKAYDEYFSTLVSSINILGNNKSLTEVKYNLDLPTTVNGTSIVWQSSNTDIITNDGRVVNPSENTAVTLIASAVSGELHSSVNISVTVLKPDDTELDAVYTNAVNLADDKHYTDSSVNALRAAIAAADRAVTGTEKEAARDMLSTAIADLALRKEYVSPFAFADSINARSKTITTGSQATLITIPDSIRDYVDVSFASADESVAVYDNGVVSGINSGKTVVTAVVTSKYNGYQREYSVAVDVTSDKAVINTAAAIENLPEASLLKVSDKASVESAASKYNSLTAKQKSTVAADLVTKLNEDNARIAVLTATAPSVTPTSGHSYRNVVTKATLTKNGKIVPTCSCGATKTATVIYSPKTFTLSAKSYTYDGKAKKPTVTVKDSKGNKIAASNYTVTYSNNKNVGSATVKLTFKGNYSGTKTINFAINPKGTTISSLTAGKKKLTVKVKKQTTQTTGYQIQYATNSKFTSAKSVTVGNTTTSKAVSGLKAKQKYFVRVRTYKTVNGTKYYSTWSSAKTVTTKK